MKTPKQGTYVLKSTHAKLRKDVNDTNIFAKKQMLLKIDAENDYREMRNKFVAIESAYAKQSETLNDLSLSYNKLVGDRNDIKRERDKFLDDLVKLEEERNKLKSDYLKATNAFVEERKGLINLAYDNLLWFYGISILAILESIYIAYLLIK